MNLKNNKDISILYLYKKGRKERLLDNKIFPSEFFYGYQELKKGGCKVNIWEEIDLSFQIKNKLIIKILNFNSKLFFNLPIKMILEFLINKTHKKINKANIVICTTNSLGVTLSFLKTLGLVKSKIIFICMGLFKKKPNFLKLCIFQFILKKIELLTLSKSEYKFLKSFLLHSKVEYLPFGVDAEFWLPKKKDNKCEAYVLAVGNDLARDWKLLVNSWEEGFPNLKIISSLPINTLKKNIEVIEGNWHSKTLNDIEMRNLYRNSEFIIIPLKETIQPSGQSTCLQAMGCSKAVVLTKVKGIWDDDLMKHKENVFFIRSGNELDLKNSVKTLVDDINLREFLGKGGRNLISSNFNSLNMSNKLKNFLFGERF
tara:strand:- start:109 stop:1221 length:1113 start_codon:yes stop_codon:yes gene_type:complete